MLLLKQSVSIYFKRFINLSFLTNDFDSVNSPFQLLNPDYYKINLTLPMIFIITFIKFVLTQTNKNLQNQFIKVLQIKEKKS